MKKGLASVKSSSNYQNQSNTENKDKIKREEQKDGSVDNITIPSFAGHQSLPHFGKHPVKYIINIILVQGSESQLLKDVELPSQNEDGQIPLLPVLNFIK